MELEGETVKRLDISNGSDKTAAVATAAEKNELVGDSGNKMTETAAAQAWILIRRRQQRDKLVIRQRQQ